MDERNDQLLRQMARLYVEESGRLLNAERDRVEAHNPPEPLGLRRKVNEKVYRKPAARRRRYALLGALAACLVLALLAPQLWRRGMGNLSGEPAPTADADGAAPGSTHDGEDFAPAEESPGETVQEPEMIQLQLTLPEYFSVLDVEQDDGKTIYYLDNTRLDDVVLTVEETAAMPDTAGMAAHSINGQPAWSLSEADYHLLTFRKDGVVYILTCRHELDTLLDLASYIL